jgi:hypothetical protein
VCIVIIARRRRTSNEGSTGQLGVKRIWKREKILARGASGKEQADEKAAFTRM